MEELRSGEGESETRRRLARARRFFARLESFDLACPHCGKVYRVRVSGGRLHSQGRHWDPVTARFRCTAKGGCRRNYVLGIVAWPVGTGPEAASCVPEDQVMNVDEIAQVRGSGWWLPREYQITARRPAETNLTTEPERPLYSSDDDSSTY